MTHTIQISEFNSNNVVTQVNNQLMTTSKLVADTFGKLHKNIIRKIESLECSAEFNQLNFEPVEYKDQKGEVRKSYNITKDGFLFLVMGFSGKKASRIKEAYINAFNDMETRLEKPETLKLEDKLKTEQDQHNYQLINNMIAQMKLPDRPVVVPYVELANLIDSSRHVQTTTVKLLKACETMDGSINQLKTLTGKSFGDF